MFENLPGPSNKLGVSRGGGIFPVLTTTMWMFWSRVMRDVYPIYLRLFRECLPVG